MGSLPSVQEVEEMLKTHRRNHEALLHLRSAVLSQEHALAEQMAQRNAFEVGGLHDDDHMAMYQEEFKSNRRFASPDLEKRRNVCFACAITLNLTLTRFYRKLLLLVVVIVVTAPKPRNGVVAQMEHELYAMPAVYTMRS
jgi:hypothetical protein